MQTITKKIEPTTQLPKGELINLTQDYAGQLLILMSVKPLDNRENSNGASFVKITPNQEQTYQIWQTTDSNGILSIYAEITAKINFHTVQRFLNGDILLVCGRSRYRGQDDYDKNGYIYTVNGELKYQILLGDGIENTQVTRDDIIWVSYFDEGVFGNYGWSNPVGSSGLVAWSKLGEIIYEFHPASGLDYISDCYALNVASNDLVYAYYYTEFDLVEIKKHKITDYWRIPIQGSNAVINYANKAVFRGGYNDQTFYLVELSNNHQAEIVDKIILEYEGENILQSGKHVSFTTARGNNMVVVKTGHVFMIPFAEFLG